MLLGLFSSLAVFQNRKKNREFMPYVAGVLQVILGFFVVVLLFADVNPFERLDFTPANGQGLNPQLQNYWMTIHPPTLYLGFTAFTVPFAFAVAALLSGRLDARWIELTRKWILTSWLFLSVGIVFGMRWAYEELGWGGYWFWDPVENASLLPWLTATAFLHSIQIQEKRGMLKVWNMSLVLADVPPHDLRDVPDAGGPHRVGPHLRAEPPDRVHLPGLHGCGAGGVYRAHRAPPAAAPERQPDRVVPVP